MSGVWVIGVVLSIVGNVIINLGTNLVKIAHERRKSLCEQQASSIPPILVLLRDPYWAGGTAMFAFGNLLNFASFGFAAQTLLSSLSSIQFVTNIVFSYFIFGEKLTRRLTSGTALIIVGNTLVVISSANGATSSEISIRQLLSNFTDVGFAMYFSVVLLLVIGIQLYFHFRVMNGLQRHIIIQLEEFEKKSAEKEEFNQSAEAKFSKDSFSGLKNSSPREKSTSSIISAIVEEIELDIHSPESKSIEKSDFNLDIELKESVKKIQSQQRDVNNNAKFRREDIFKISFSSLVSNAPNWSSNLINNSIKQAHPDDKNVLLSLIEIRLLPIIYAGQSAIFGSLSVLLAKALSSLVRTSFRGNLQLDQYGFWIILFLWLAVMTFWLVRMNLALKMFNGIVIIPTLQVFWIVFSIISGGIFFQEFRVYSSLSLFFFVCAVALILAGVVTLTSRIKRSKSANVEDINQVEKMNPSDFSFVSFKGTIAVLKSTSGEMSLLNKVCLVPHWDASIEVESDVDPQLDRSASK